MRNMYKDTLLCLLVATIFVMPISAVMDNHEVKSSRLSTGNPYIKTTYMVPMRDGVLLATDVYLTSEECPPHGTILIRTPYNKENIRGYFPSYKSWLDSGWPIVVQDCRGFYASEGIEDAFMHAHTDGPDTAQWIASQDWSNGKIATHGYSALGICQYYMAGANPSELSCQFIMVATPDLHKDSMFQGGEWRKSNNELWYERHNLLFDPLEISDIENFTLDSQWTNVSLENKWQDVNVPAIHIGGWYDIFAQGIIDGFMGYQYHGGEDAKGKSKLIMGPWTHISYITSRSRSGEIIYPAKSKDTFSGDMFEDMVNQYTMDAHSDYDDWPTVSYYVMGDVDDLNTTGNEWRYSDVWPIPASEIPFYFDEGELLNQDLPGSNTPLTYTYDPTNPVPTLGGQNNENNDMPAGPYDQTAIEDREDVLIFTSPILNEPVETTGHIKARLFVSSSCVDTDFTVKLTDVYPDGRSMLITDGILRMRNRDGRDHWEFMTPGEIYEIEVDLLSTSYILSTGHRIRVAISSSNYPRFLANPNTADGIYRNTTYNIAQNTLYLNNDYPSCIILPIVEPKEFISSPREGYLYIGGREILPLPTENAVILGKQNIEINTEMEYGIDNVEFYIDDELKETDDETPYEWLWDETIFGEHTIKTIAYAQSGKTMERNLQVLIFNL